MSPSAHSIGRHGFHHIACSSMPRALPPPGSPSPGLVRVRPGRVSGGSCPSGYAKYERVGGWATHRWRATRRCPRPQPWLPAQRPCSAAHPQTLSVQNEAMVKKKKQVFRPPVMFRVRKRPRLEDLDDVAESRSLGKQQPASPCRLPASRCQNAVVVRACPSAFCCPCVQPQFTDGDAG